MPSTFAACLAWAATQGPLAAGQVLLANPEEGYVRNLAIAALRDLHCNVELTERFKGEVGEAHCLEVGDANGENHWDKFLETPVAQAAIRAEMKAEGILPDSYLDAKTPSLT